MINRNHGKDALGIARDTPAASYSNTMSLEYCKHAAVAYFFVAVKSQVLKNPYRTRLSN